MIPSILVLLLSYNLSTALLFENDDCTVPESNKAGKCINVSECQYARQLLKENRNPQVCGFSGNTPLVCCPQDVPRPGALSRKMCDEYFNVRQQVFAIDLGQKALSKEFPHMAAVGYGDNVTSLLWLCGGTLISHFFVLTAAHCVYSQDFGPARYVRLGDLDLKNTTEDASPLDLKIVETFVHPEYRASSHYHDIALFKLGEYVPFASYFKAACLQVDRDLPTDVLQATGWGKLGYFGDSSSHLMKVSLRIVSHGVCAKKYSTVSKRRLKDGILDSYQMCAGDSAGGDTCPGDSGGPLHYRKDRTEELVSHFVVAGVTSFGKGCGGEDSVGVYTRVSSYIGWIESIVWPEKGSNGF